MEEADESVDAVIQLTGGVLQSLFSVAYTDDVRKVVDRIDSIDADLKENINVVQTSQDSLKQRTVNSLSKQDNKIYVLQLSTTYIQYLQMFFLEYYKLYEKYI